MAPPRPFLLLLLALAPSVLLAASTGPRRPALNALPHTTPLKNGLKSLKNDVKTLHKDVKLLKNELQTPLKDALAADDADVASLSARYDEAVTALLDPFLDASSASSASPALLTRLHAAPSALLHPALRRAFLGLLEAECNATTSDYHQLRRALQKKDKCLRRLLTSSPPPASEHLSGREALIEAAVCQTGRPALACLAPPLEAAAACSGRAAAVAALLAAAHDLVDDYCHQGADRLLEGLRASDQQACLAQGVGYLLRQMSPNAFFSQHISLLPHRSALCQYVTYVAKVTNFHLRYFCGASDLGSSISSVLDSFLSAAHCHPATLWSPQLFS